MLTFLVSILLLISVPDVDFFSKNAPLSQSLISLFVFPDYYFFYILSVAVYSTINSSYNKHCVIWSC